MKIGKLILLSWFLLGLPAGVQAQFIYTTNNGCITVTGYSGTNSDVVIPNTIGGLPVTGIGSFYSSSSMTSIAIPDSVTNITSGALAGQFYLAAILVDSDNQYYSSSNGVLFDKYQTVLIQAPEGISGGYVVPGTVTSIGDGAFEYSYDLTNVVIGSNVSNIGFNAFFDCGGLTAITVDNQNESYSSVNGVLFDKDRQTLIQAPGGMAGSFAIPDSVTNIASDAFYGCFDLANVTFGTNVIIIGEEAFSFCSSLTNLAIPNEVTSIGEGAFEDCSGLTGITLGTNVVSIGAYAFYSCLNLSELVVPNSVTNIGGYVMAYCGSLTNIILGNQVAYIGDDAFRNCGRLTGVAIPASVTSLGNGVFSGCSSLTAITVDGQNTAISSINGVLYNKVQTTLIQMPGGFVGNYVLPDSVTNVVNGALAGCGYLTAITNDGGDFYFSTVNGVLFDKAETTLIQFPGGLGVSYTVAYGVVRLGTTAFSGCSNLTRVTIPSSVTNVGTTTFAGSPHLGIYFEGNAPSITSSGRFGGLPGVPINFHYGYDPNSEAVYYLPGTTGWGTAFDGLTAYLWVPPFACTPASNSITISGFNGSGGSIVIPDTINGLPVNGIGNGAFDNLGGFGLTNIVLGTTITTIGNYAFAACANLASITIPDGVTNIGSEAFVFCDNLTSVYFQGDAPIAGTGVFFQWTGIITIPPIYEPPTPTTVYYLPGTTGWGSIFAGQPAVLWNPTVQTSGSFGVSEDGFGFNITGSSNLAVMVEASTNLSSPDWQPVQTVTLTNGTAYFSDSQWSNYPGRFYRLRSP